MQRDELLTTDELAARWGVTRGHLQNQRHRGESPVGYCKIGNRVAYRLADVLAFEEANYIPAGA